MNSVTVDEHLSEKDKLLSEMRERLINAYPKVFADTLQGSSMDVEPVTVELRPDARKPKMAYTAREPPVHHRQKAQALIQDLLKQGIIEEVRESTEYCSRANFVPKPCGEELRLVTDFRGINKMIVRPVYPFESTQSILNNINSEEVYVAALDMLSGYFQIRLDEAASQFLLHLGASLGT